MIKSFAIFIVFSLFVACSSSSRESQQKLHKLQVGVPSTILSKSESNSFVIDSIQPHYENAAQKEVKATRKILILFSCQMLTTIAITAVVAVNDGFRLCLYRHLNSLFKISLLSMVSAGFVAVSIIMKSRGTKTVGNADMYLLGLHILSQSVMIGALSTVYNAKLICLGTAHTLIAFIALLTQTYQPKINLVCSLKLCVLYFIIFRNRISTYIKLLH